MKLNVNGEKYKTDSETVHQLLDEHDMNIEEGGFAVAVNDALVPRQDYKSHELEEDDHVEIIQATQGG